MVSSAPAVHCDTKQICETMNGYPAVFSLLTWNQTYFMQELGHCEQHVSSIWVMVNVENTVDNLQYNFTVEELRTDKSNRRICNPHMDVCSAEQNLDEAICGPTSFIITPYCCKDLNYVMCEDVDECSSASITSPLCEPPSGWPCDVNITCHNYVGGHACLMPAPQITVSGKSHNNAMLMCTSCDPCVTEMVESNPNNTMYVWYVDGVEVADLQSKNVLVGLTNETSIYQCVIVVNETQSIESSKLYVDFHVRENVTACDTEDSGQKEEELTTEYPAVATEPSSTAVGMRNTSSVLAPSTPPFSSSDDQTTQNSAIEDFGATNDPKEEACVSNTSSSDFPLCLSSAQDVISEGSSVWLNCFPTEHTSVSSTFSWLRNGEIFHAGEENTLQITDFTSADEGVYQCRSGNSPTGTLSSNTLELTLVGRYQQCACPCSPSSVHVNMTESQVRQTVASLQAELLVDTSRLSATARRKSSALDLRPVSQSVGVISALLMAGILGAVVASDLTRVFDALERATR